MTIEQKVKQLILLRHKTLKEFAKLTNMPYGTVDGMLRRGFRNSNADNVFTLCKALNISADELAKGNIAPYDKSVPKQQITDVYAIIQYALNDSDTLTIDSAPVTREELDTFMDAVDLAIELIRRKRNRP